MAGDFGSFPWPSGDPPWPGIYPGDGRIYPSQLPDIPVIQDWLRTLFDYLLAHSTFEFAATGATLLRPVGDWLSDAVNVRAFGATGNGTTDDTVAIQAAFAYAQAHGKSVWVPGGIYSLSSAISWANAPLTLRGDGLGVSVLRWTASASSSGISFAANADTQCLTIEGIALWAQGSAGTAILADFSGQISGGVTVNRSAPRLTIRNVWLRSNGANVGWGCGVDIVSGLICNIDNLFIEGWRTGSAGNSYGQSVGIRMRGTGHPVQLVISSCSIYAVLNAIQVVGIEGLHVAMCNLVGVQNGILFDDSPADAGSSGGRPLCVVTGSHINACGAGIYADSMSELIVSNNDIYMCSDILPTGGAGLGVYVTGSFTTAGKVTGNNFSNSADSTLATMTAVYLDKADNCMIDGNTFRNYSHGTMNGIYISGNCRGCTVGDGNKFATDYGAPVPFGFEVQDVGLVSDIPNANVVVTKNADLVIPANIPWNVNWDAVQTFNSNNGMWTISSASIVSVAVKGWYRISANLHWAADGGFRDAFITHNGAHQVGLPFNSVASSTSWQVRQDLSSGPVFCNAGDYFGVTVNASQATTLVGDDSTWLAVEKI